MIAAATRETKDASETLMVNSNIAKSLGSSLLPLSVKDFLGGSNGGASLASPSLMPLSTPEMRSGGRFRQALGAANLKPMDATDHIPGVRRAKTGQSQHDALTEQAQKWVAQTFYGTLMKQMHDSPFKSELFSGGRGAEAFQPLMDQHLIDHMSRASGKKLVRGIVRQIEGRDAYRKQKAEESTKQEAPVGAYDAVNGAKSAAPATQPSDLPSSNRKVTRVAPGLRA